MIDDRLSYPLSFRDSISVLYSGIVLVQAFLRMVKAPRLKTGKSLGTIQSQGFPVRTPYTPFGGDKRDRTADLLNAIQALSQLSYTPK